MHSGRGVCVYGGMDIILNLACCIARPFLCVQHHNASFMFAPDLSASPPTMIRLVVVVSHRLHIGYHAHLCIGQTRLFALISVTIISLAPDTIDPLVFLRMDFQQRQIITCCLMRRKVRQIRKLVIMSHQKHGFTCVCVSVCVCVCVNPTILACIPSPRPSLLCISPSIHHERIPPSILPAR